MIDIVPYQPSLAPALLALWQAAAGSGHPIIPALWEASTASDPSFRPADLRVAMAGDTPVGFALTKRLREQSPDLAKFDDIGWLAALAVTPEQQRQGLGARLLADAEAHLAAEGAERVVLGGSFHHWLPGVPDSLPHALDFFQRAGYVAGRRVWDVRRDVGLGAPLRLPTLPAGITVRPLVAGEEPALLNFLGQAFPGRWRRDVAQFLATGGAVSDVVGLFTPDGLAGFAHLGPPGGRVALRWAGFDPKAAALGPIGVSDAVRGQGLGLALLEGGLARLVALGARTTVIDWTDLLDFYARVGFTPWLGYTLAEKRLA